MTRATTALLIALFVIPASAARRQERQDLISKDLAALLLADYGTALTITEGRPPGFPAEVIPDDATVRVALHGPGVEFVVADAARFGSVKRARYERKLAADGWARRVLGVYTRGLASSATTPSAVFCRDDAYVTYTVTPRRDGGNWVRVNLSSGASRGPCSQPGGPHGRPSMFDDEQMPILTPPAESRILDWSGGGGGDVVEQRVSLETRLAHAAVADHYVSQATEHGWTIEDRASTEGITLVRLTGSLGSGEPIVAVLGTMAMPSGAVHVSLQIFDARAARR